MMKYIKFYGKLLKHGSRSVISKSRCFSTLDPPIPAEKQDLIVVDHIQKVTTIGINRPEKKNCVNFATAEALLKAVQDFDNDDSSAVAVLHGIGGNFCAGYDLEEIANNPHLIKELPKLERGPMGPTYYETKKPVIAAVEGYAVAGGLELALWCDVRIVEETAIFGVFCRRFGVPLIDGGTVRLPAIVGVGNALDLILLGRTVKADEALRMGLATKVVACGTGLGEAIKYARSVAQHPQECMKADRASVRHATFSSTSLKEALEFERKSFTVVEKEGLLGAQKFLEGFGRHGKHITKKDT